ncbi:MAG TPA: hypothetical protein VFB12_32355 [Ktedonobacteraceae bacterium]|nr:hypothetical protein [Ktedonobacteraceae bacterium]
MKRLTFTSIYGYMKNRWWLLLLALICSIVFFITSFWYVQERSIAPTGDEPHYLVISQTLLIYHSLDVMKDYQHGDYKSFYPRNLDAHVTPNLRGELLPVHGIGGPVLWLIPFALVGRLGAVLFMSLISVLIIINIYKFLIVMGISTRYAFFVSLAYALASPFYIYSHLDFIEPIAAFFCIYVLRKIFQEEITVPEVVISAIFLGLLPWIHIRFALLEIALFFALLYKIYQKNGWSNFRYYIFYLIPSVLLFLAFELFNYKVWGTLNPAANQAGMVNQPFTRKPTTGLLWLFLDQEYGVFFNFPLFFFLLVGILLALKRKFAAYHLLVLVTTIPYLIVIASLVGWQGGYTPPTRFILVLLPIWSFYVAYAVERLNNIVSTLTMGIAMLIGFLYNLLSLEHSFNRNIWQVIDVWHITIFHRSLSSFFPTANVLVPPQLHLFIAWIGIYLLISLCLWSTQFLRFIRINPQHKTSHIPIS